MDTRESRGWMEHSKEKSMRCRSCSRMALREWIRWRIGVAPIFHRKRTHHSWNGVLHWTTTTH